MKKVMIKWVSLTLACLAIATTKVTITRINESMVQLEQSLDDSRKETEKLSKDIVSKEQRIKSLEKDLDSARQEENRLAKEIKKAQVVSKKRVVSPPKLVRKPSFSPDSDVRTIRVTNGAVLDKGLRGNLKGLGSAFVDAGIKHNIDPLFLASIAAQESGWGQFDHGNNNLFGISSGAKSFSSKASSIYYTASLLSKYYVGEGRTTPRKIQPKYCPSPSNWHFDISSCANTIIRNL